MVKQKTTTIRISEETKESLDETKGKELSYDKFVAYLLEFFLTKK